MSCPIFSQIDTVSEDMVCIPTIQARQIASELVQYDLCKIERDSLRVQINDLNTIISEKTVLLNQFKLTTDSLVTINQDLLKTTSYQSLELITKEEKIKRLKKTRNLSIVTTVIGAVLPALLTRN